MSIVRRMAAGNVAGLAAIFFNLAAQIALVPVFLHYWDAVHYGLWLAIVTAIGLITIIDNAHLDYLGYACMGLPLHDRDGRSRILSDAVPAVLLVGVAQFVLLLAFLFSPLLAHALDRPPDAPEITVARVALIVMMAVWYLLQLPVGLIGRGLTSVGRFPLTAWWYLPSGFGQALIPAIVVTQGGGMADAITAYVATTVILFLLNAIHYAHVARREGLRIHRPGLARGLRRFGAGAGLGAAALLEYGQQAGLRLVLLPFFGAAGLVQFATLRTVANVVQQGMITLINPAVPEMMRFVSARDDVRMRAVAVGLLWITVILMCPGYVLMQSIVPPLFALWTHGKVSFQPVVFGALSASVLMFGLTQASRAIVRGNNLVAPQVATTAVCGGVLLIAVFGLAGWLGVGGAAVGVLLAEIVRFGLTYIVASRWKRAHGFSSLRDVTVVAFGGVTVTVIVLALIALLPQRRLAFSLLYIPIWLLLNLVFWRAIAGDVRSAMIALASNLRIVSILRVRLTLLTSWRGRHR